MRSGELEELRVRPESLGLPRTTRAQIPWKGAHDERRAVLEALGGGHGPVRNLLLYNATLRLWAADESSPLEEHVEKAHSALDSGETLDLLGRLGSPAAVYS